MRLLQLSQIDLGSLSVDLIASGKSKLLVCNLQSLLSVLNIGKGNTSTPNLASREL